MAHATWHYAKPGFRNTGLVRGFKPPSEETAILVLIGAIIAAVVILHMRDAVKPRPDASPGIAIEAVALTPVEVPLAGPRIAEPVVPPPPVAMAPEDKQAVPALPPPASVRTLDLANMTALRNLAKQTGADLDPSRTSYGDLSGAGDVALVPLQSGGSAGTLGVAVIGGGRDGGQMLTLVMPDATSRARLRVELETGELVVTTAVLGPEDPLCCPSSTRRSYYTWDGAKLQLQRVVTAENVSAKN
jgi:hypothetical protein